MLLHSQFMLGFHPLIPLHCGQPRRPHARILISSQQIMGIFCCITIRLARNLPHLVPHLLALVEVSVADVPILSLPILSLGAHYTEVLHGLASREPWQCS